MNPTTPKTDPAGTHDPATTDEPGTTTAAGPGEHRPEPADEHTADSGQERDPKQDQDQKHDQDRKQDQDREAADAHAGPATVTGPAAVTGAATGPAGGIATAAAAVVAAALGLASLTGTWTGRVAAERETLLGQIATAQGGSPAQQISEIYGDAWHTTALVNGLFAVVALITAVVVLTRPRRPQWVRAVATAGAVLGALGLLLSVGMFTDWFLPLPSTGS
ncbi:hypothetical protein [Streptomyces sp. NPDC015131]|uniref:hypothetical protein n=1 Tax=Streptomyces sp. NPDC015131 TaxID=3364941 RepID=UPI0037033F16